MKKTHFLSFDLGRWLIFFVAAVANTATFAASHSWLGTTSAFWTVGSNWTNNQPLAGDDLYFVAGNINNQSNYNNYPSGTAFGRITISEGNQVGYVLAGNPITLNTGIAASGTILSIQPQIDLNITCNSNILQTWTSSRSLAINGTVDLKDGVVVINNSGTITITGKITDSSTGDTSGWLFKTNSGLLYFTAGSRLESPNYYEGSLSDYPLDVGQGHLRFDGFATNYYNGEIGTAKTYSIYAGTNSGGATTLVDGTGHIDGLDVAGATLSPGDGAPGILRCDLLTLYGTLNIQINGTNAGTDYSQIVTGTDPSYYGTYLGAGNSCPPPFPAILNLQFGYTPQIGDSYLIINGVNGGYFGGLVGDCLFQTNGSAFGIHYEPYTGITVTKVWDSSLPYTLWNGSTNLNNRYWSSTNNWLNGTAPTNGSRLEFTAYQTRDQSYCIRATNAPPLTNDLSGTSIASILLTTSNYAVYGNPLTVTEGITNSISAGTNYFYCNLVGSGSTALVVQDGSVLQTSGQFAGGGTIHKQGGGELLITGTTHFSFNGTMSLEGGATRVDGAFLDGSFTISSGTLTGGGTVSTTTLNGGTLSPGDGVGVMQVQGNLTMNGGSVLQLQLNGTSPGVTYDQLMINGAVNINGATLTLQTTNNFNPGDTFFVVVNDGTDAISGSFAGLPEGAVFSAGGQYFAITYSGGTGNDIVITRVDPPATFSTIIPTATNTVQLSGTAGSNLFYTIQATTNLTTKNWSNIGTAPVDGTGHFNFIATNLLQFPQRFFRALAP